MQGSWRKFRPESLSIRDKKGVDWGSSTTLVTIILAIIIGLAFIFYIIKLKGRLIP